MNPVMNTSLELVSYLGGAVLAAMLAITSIYFLTTF